MEEILEKIDGRRVDAVSRVSKFILGIQNGLMGCKGPRGAEDNRDVVRRFEETAERLTAEDDQLLADLKNLESDE